MPTEAYNYELIARHPKLLAIYSGWLGQKIHFLTHSAVTGDQPNLWSSAAPEMDRLVLLLHYAAKAKLLNLSGETAAALGELIGHFAAGGWWTSKDGIRERAAYHRNRREPGEFPGDEPDPDDAPFQPQLLLERDPVYSVAPTVLSQLDTLLVQTAVATDNLDLCRLGASLGGFCYRSTPQLHTRFISSLLDDLAARDVTDLESENVFRRTASLPGVIKDHRSRPNPPPLPHGAPDDAAVARSKLTLSTSYVGDLADHRDLVLGCVFNRFGVMVPPAEVDTSQYPELADLKKTFRGASVKATKSLSSGTEGERQGKGAGAVRGHLWIDDAIAYLGADQLGVNPQKFIYRLIKKGALPAKKINGRFVFFKADLDRMIANGDHKRTPGRPRKGPSA
jgi:hypothetical protein